MRLLLFALLTISASLAGQQPVYRFEKGHPLLTGYITAVAESQDGFLYVASQAGLRRYDGKDVLSLGAAYGELGGSIHTLLEGPDRLLWIGHHKGLSCSDPALARFTNYGFPAAADLTDPTKTTLFRLVLNDTANTLFGLTDQGLVTFNTLTQKFIPASGLRQQQDSLGTGHCTDIIRAGPGKFLLACSGGIFQLAEDSLRLTVAYRDQREQLGSFSLAGTPADGLLVGGLGVVYRLQLMPTGELALKDSISLTGAAPANRSYCRQLYSPVPGTYYVATYNGLHTINWKPGQPFAAAALTASYYHDPDEENSLSSDQLNHLTASASGLLWIGTRKGVNRLPIGPTPFTNVQRIPGEVELCNNHTKGSAVDPVHKLLVLGTTTGLSIYNYREGTWACYTPANLAGLRSAYLVNVDPGPAPHTFWLLYRRGGADLLDLTDPQSPKIRPGIHPPGATDVTHAYEVAYQADGTCYIATGRGLYVYDPLTEKSFWLQHDPADSTSLPDNYCYSVLVDHLDQVWVGTRTKGLSRLTERDGHPEFISWRHHPDDPNSLSSDLILNIFEDQQQQLWISTPGGISRWRAGGRFSNYSTADGLPHPLSYGIFADQSDQLWAVQGGQITRIGLDKEQKFIVGAGFRQRDGMTDDFCVQYGWSMFPDGRLAISHPNGLTLFHPDSLRKDAYLPPVLLTEVQLFNQPLPVSGGVADSLEGAFSLPLAPHLLTSLHLPPGQNFLSLTFAAPEFRPFRSPNYSWRMTGMQETWVTTNGRNYLSFPKLPPGKYALEIRSGDAYGNWSEHIRQLEIVLAYPWYQRSWAYGFFILLAATMLFSGFRFFERQRQRVETARQQEREELRRRSARDFHDEAGNHLSRVSLLTTLAQRKLENNEGDARTQVQGMLHEISSNTQVLREGMRDFIWALDPDNDNARELALRLKRFGQDLFAHHPASFIAGPFSATLATVSLRADERRHLILLTKEAMHNSLKHALTASKLYLKIEVQDNLLHLTWSDNGPGFDADGDPKEMGLKSMRARAEKLGARFDLSSENGCTISVLLPLSPK